jgi:3-hydroxyisobutyrate dehydrogenase-like beta-hydroxyacid dehydrogenase
MRVAVLGLGLMGRPIADRLLDAGHELAVFNRTRAKAEEVGQRGARVLERPADAWGAADVAISMLADEAATDEVATGEDGLLTADAGTGRTYVDMSTISVAASERLARAAESAGVEYLRAPVTGNPSVVVAGNLGIIVSGPEEVFARVRPVLEAIGPNLFYVGAGEEARVTKLCLNLMIAGTAQLIAEALALGESHGIERRPLLEVVGGSAIGSPFVKYKTDALVEDDYSTTFTTRGMVKDLSLALAAGGDRDVPLPVTAHVQQLLESCISQGMAELDFVSLVARLEREAGLREDLPRA